MKEALADLHRAAEELTAPTRPATPLPRPRVIELSPGYRWPAVENGRPRYDLIIELPHEHTRYVSGSALPGDICRSCGFQPRRVLRALRRIQAAAAWCRARAEGRRRMAEEILRQQARAVEALEAEAALNALAGGGRAV